MKAAKIIPTERLLDDALDAVQAFVDLETVRFYAGDLGILNMEDRDMRVFRDAIDRQRMPRQESVHDVVMWMGENARCKAAHLLRDEKVKKRRG